MSIPPFTTLASIINKVRRLTGSGNSFQLPSAQPSPNPNNIVSISDYINSFYLYDLPAKFRSLKLKDKYTFDTIQGVDTYAFDSEHYTTVEMPVYCAKREIQLFTDPWSFYGVNFNWQTQQNFTSGDGTPGPYSGTCQAIPLIASVNNNPTNLNYPAGRVQNLLITANTATSTINVTDYDNGNGTGTLYLSTDTTAASIGSINYQTGAISITSFGTNIPLGNAIQIQYNPQQLAIPLSILFFQNQFTLRPVPDRGYTIELIAYRQPTQALALTPANAGTAELNEWWEMIAFGAAKKVYQDRLDPDGEALMDRGLKQAYDTAETRTYAQIGKARINTIFSDQLNYNYGASGGFFGSV